MQIKSLFIQTGQVFYFIHKQKLKFIGAKEQFLTVLHLKSGATTRRGISKI